MIIWHAPGDSAPPLHTWHYQRISPNVTKTDEFNFQFDINPVVRLISRAGGQWDQKPRTGPSIKTSHASALEPLSPDTSKTSSDESCILVPSGEGRA